MLADVGGLHSDDHPVVEYLSPRANYADTQTPNDAGVQALQTKRLPAIAGFDEARDFDARARYLLGFGMASIGRVDPAIGLMEESVRGEKPDPKFLVGLANQYQAKGMNAKAIRAYERALALAPDDAEASLKLAELLRAQGDDPAADKVLAAALARAKEDATLAAARARLLLDLNRPADALNVLAPAIPKAPGALLHLLAGEAFAAAGDREQAVAALRQALAAEPDNADTQRRGAEALLALEDVEAARAAFDRAATLDPASAAALVGLAQAELRRGNAAGARAARERALAIDPYNTAALGMAVR